MARPTKDKQRVSVGASVLPELAAEIDVIAIKEDRTKSQIIERLLLRGLAAYNRDGKLSEATDNPDVGGGKTKQDSEALSSNYLMSDPKGANAGTKKLPLAIQKDIADAKAHVKKLKQQRS